MNKEAILEEIIEGYRRSIDQRYQYQNIRAHHDIPDSVKEATVDAVREYFLNYIYPAYAKRAELNEAFDSLNNYIGHPEKLARILMDSVKLLFRHGRHLPKLLNSGLTALKSFRVANTFENNLVEEAIKNEVEGPFDETEINGLIKALPRQDMEDFIESLESLFAILFDRPLLEKINEVLQYLLNTMKENTSAYSEKEVRGLELGSEMIQAGETLSEKLSKREQRILVRLIVQIEKATLEDIFTA